MAATAVLSVSWAMHPVGLPLALEGADAGLPLQLEVSAVPSVQELLHMQLPPPPRVSGHNALLRRCRSCNHSETSKRKEFELPP